MAVLASAPTHDDETVMNGAPGFVGGEKRSGVSHRICGGTKRCRGWGPAFVGGGRLWVGHLPCR